MTSVQRDERTAINREVACRRTGDEYTVIRKSDVAVCSHIRAAEVKRHGKEELLKQGHRPLLVRLAEDFLDFWHKATCEARVTLPLMLPS